MKRIGRIFIVMSLALVALVATQPVLGQDTGTLVFDVKNYTSDVKLPKNLQKNFLHSGIEWGMLDNTLVISLVNRTMVKAKITNLTRFGEQQELELKPGQYTITCIGYEWRSKSKELDKNLSKSAFFNNDVVTFTVLPGKKTTLEVHPVYVAESQWVLWEKMNLYIPDLKVRVVEDGNPVGEDVVISKRTDKSVAWNDYHGPLKF